MPTLLETKQRYLQRLNSSLAAATERIARQAGTRQKKAQAVNSAIAEIASPLREAAIRLPNASDRQSALIVLQYCLSVVSLEYRHRVWPYEYMAFSRRVGELWERFCSACWDHPSREGVTRIDEPSFAAIISSIRQGILENSRGAADQQQIMIYIDHLLDLIGDVNMKEDEVFQVHENPHVIDFKSGFGSNEKGNMLRLTAVGRAYRLWNPSTTLLLLVRQEQNNNYLNVIRRQGLWEVHCGTDAYNKIDELTGARMEEIRDEVVSFEDDLSPTFLANLDENPSNLRAYLEW